jgi:2-methylcitrate dehydratase PrpD
MDETKTIAKYVAELDYSSIPTKILDEMKVLLFDYMGVALGGTRTESGGIAAQFSKELGEKGEATIIGFGYQVSAPSAAFSNAILSHSIELDDVDSLAYFHFSPPILSAALAMGEREHCSGQDLLVAMVAGCDLMARLSSAPRFVVSSGRPPRLQKCSIWTVKGLSTRLVWRGRRHLG